MTDEPNDPKEPRYIVGGDGWSAGPIFLDWIDENGKKRTRIVPFSDTEAIPLGLPVMGSIILDGQELEADEDGMIQLVLKRPPDADDTTD